MTTKNAGGGFGIVISRTERGAMQYRGTQAALIDAGVCTKDQFPIAPKRKRFGFENGWWQVTRCRGGVFEFQCPAKKRPEREPAPLRKSAEQFKEDIMLRCEVALAIIFELDVVIDPDTGERLAIAPEARHATINALRQAIEAARVEQLPRSPGATVRSFRSTR